MYLGSFACMSLYFFDGNNVEFGYQVNIRDIIKAEKVRKAPQKQKAPVQQNQQPPGWMKAELGRF